MGKAEENKQHKRLSLLNTAFELFTTKGSIKQAFPRYQNRQALQREPSISILRINMISAISL